MQFVAYRDRMVTNDHLAQQKKIILKIRTGNYRYNSIRTFLLVGMHRISGRIIRPFLFPVSGRTPDFTAGYPVRPDTEYPAGYSANVDLILLFFKFLQ
jgi:hypothetical protein